MHPYSPLASVTLAEVLDAPSLGVRLVGPGHGLHRPLRWASVTELADPRPFLDGGELVLTTGLRQRTAAAQREFVVRIAERDVAGLGFGTGLAHARVPRATVTAAAELGLALVEVPYATPFLAIDRFVASRVLAARAGAARHLLGLHDDLARALTSGRGLAALLDVLRGQLGGHAAVLDPLGTVIASSPAAATWPSLGHAAREGVLVRPVPLGPRPGPWLCIRAPMRDTEVLPYVVTLVALELVREQAALSGQHRVLGQALLDVVCAVVPPAEGLRRLSQVGVDARGEVQVLLVATGRRGHAAPARGAPAHTGPGAPLPGVPGPGAPLPAELPIWTVPAYLDGQAHVAVSSEGVAVIIEGDTEDSAHQETLARRLLDVVAGEDRAVAVGIGGRHEGVTGLRWSYLEAEEALSRGPGVHAAQPLSMTGLLRAARELPLAELAETVLAPLRHADATGARLLETVRAYLQADGDVAAVAARLYIHRNTVRYRLRQVEALTGLSMSSTRDRTQLWLALEVVG